MHSPAGVGVDGAAVVPVHLYADESIRAQAGWKLRLDTALRFAADELSGSLGLRLVAASISGFDTAGVSSDLDSIHAAFTRATAAPPGPGILVAFTGRPVPDGRSETKWGLAEFLGRRLTVRLPPGEERSRALTHELLHLYGAMHVPDSIESLMNPSGDSRRLDPLSRRTVTAMRSRSFESGRLGKDVLPRVDLREVVDAYVDALGANFAVRPPGADAVPEPRQGSQDADPGPAGVGRDSGLADVAMKVAALMLCDGRRSEAVSLFETASLLYGARTPRGTVAAKHAEDLRRAMRSPSDP